MNSAAWYSRFAKSAAHFCGRPRVFTLAVGVIAVWILTGPLFGFSDLPIGTSPPAFYGACEIDGFATDNENPDIW